MRRIRPPRSPRPPPRAESSAVPRAHRVAVLDEAAREVVSTVSTLRRPPLERLPQVIASVAEALDAIRKLTRGARQRVAAGVERVAAMLGDALPAWRIRPCKHTRGSTILRTIEM